MNKLRESLIDHMVQSYGFEHPAVIQFSRLCERWPEGWAWDKCLRVICERAMNEDEDEGDE